MKSVKSEFSYVRSWPCAYGPGFGRPRFGINYKVKIM